MGFRVAVLGFLSLEPSPLKPSFHRGSANEAPTLEPSKLESTQALETRPQTQALKTLILSCTSDALISLGLRPN